MAVVAWLAAEKCEPYAEIVRFAVATAMCRGEIARLEWGYVDEEKRLVIVRDRNLVEKRKRSVGSAPGRCLGGAETPSEG